MALRRNKTANHANTNSISSSTEDSTTNTTSTRKSNEENQPPEIPTDFVKGATVNPYEDEYAEDFKEIEEQINKVIYKKDPEEDEDEDAKDRLTSHITSDKKKKVLSKVIDKGVERLKSEALKDITLQENLITQEIKTQNSAPTPTSPLNNEEDQPPEIPSEFTRRDFTSEKALVRHKVGEVITLIELGEVDSGTLEQLGVVVDNHRKVIFDEEYDMRDELHTMMQMVQAVRSSILTSDNRIARDTTVQEVKAVLDASMRLTQLLNKSNKEIINMDRIRAIEAAFLEVIGDLPEDKQKQYVDNLEHRMKLSKELTKEVT